MVTAFDQWSNFIRIEEEPRKPLEYSIVKNEEIPAELAALIQEKKKNEFQLTYQCEKDLFLVKGYGEAEAEVTVFPWKNWGGLPRLFFSGQCCWGHQTRK